MVLPSFFEIDRKETKEKENIEELRKQPHTHIINIMGTENKRNICLASQEKTMLEVFSRKILLQ